MMRLAHGVLVQHRQGQLACSMQKSQLSTTRVKYRTCVQNTNNHEVAVRGTLDGVVTVTGIVKLEKSACVLSYGV